MKRRLPHPARGQVGHMSSYRRLALYATSLAVWGTGALWLAFHYFLQEVDSFGFEVPHAGEKWTLIAHALVSFYAIWWFGLLWSNHIKAGWKTRVRRVSGGILFVAITWLALSGYLLYYIGSEAWRSWASVLHWTVGLAAVAAFMFHLLTRTPRAAGQTTRQGSRS